MHPCRGDRRIRISENEIASVDACHCGVLSLHLGTFSVRFTVDGLVKLHEAIEHALRRIDRLPAPEQPANEVLLFGSGTKSGSA